MPFVHGVAVMPDCHLGKGSTVGTVVATEGAVMPACVGVDIGCGMIAVKTSLTPAQVYPHLRTLREGIERRIPTGIGPFGMNSRILPSAERRIALLEERAKVTWEDSNHMNARAHEWRNQVGSLGGGNHFIEVCIGHSLAAWEHDEQGTFTDEGGEEVWVILHSGSRAVGNKTGNHWTQVAKRQAKRYKYDAFLPDPDLSYLVKESEEYWEYMKEVMWCQYFALLNREEMMDRALDELYHTILQGKFPTGPAGLEMERINCHHNYVTNEEYDGKKLLITRKGAIFAGVGEKALIPGSMGARSYIVEGLGHPGSFNSAPHGAGRRMSRRRAREEFTEDNLRQMMQDLGIETRVRDSIVDESPGAYKDIDTVMEEAKELVRPIHTLQQIISVKGD